MTPCAVCPACATSKSMRWAGWVIFPRYEAGSEPLLSPRDKTPTFTHFAQNAFNYSILGELGFDTVGRLVEQCDCYDFVYSRLEDALEVFDWLSESAPA